MGSPAIADPNEGWVDVPATPPAAAAAPADSGWIDVPDTSDTTPKPPPPQSATDFLLNRAPRSIVHAAQNIGHAAIHPIDTAEKMGELMAGTLRAAARGAGIDMGENESDQLARSSWEYLKNRYGGMDRIKNSLYEDPAGVVMDLSAALSGAGGLARGAGALSGVEAASTLGRTLTTAGEVTNPLYAPSKLVSGAVNRFAPKTPVEAPLPAFDPKTGAFEEQPVFNPATATFETGAAAARPSMRETVEQLQQKWGIKKPPPAAPVAAPPSVPTGGSNIKAMLTGAGLTGLAVEALAHHMLGRVGAGALAVGAIKYLPMFLKSETGQQMLAKIGSGSNAAAVASVAQDMVPALNAFGRNYQASMSQPSALDARAKGGMVNPELARIQRDRLRLPGILETLGKGK